MKMFKAILSWLVFNGVAAALVYFGYFAGVAGAVNVFNFLAVFMAIYSAIINTDNLARHLAKNNLYEVKPAWYYRIDSLYDIGILFALLWSGNTFIGTLYLLHIIFLAGFIQKVKKAYSEIESDKSADSPVEPT